MKDERDNGAYRATPAADPPAPPAVDGAFWAKISSSTPLGGGRWSYAFDEIEKTAAAYGGWATLSAGRSGTAYNAAEDVGYMGAAIADNAIVLVREVVVDGESAPEYWILAVNSPAPVGGAHAWTRTGSRGGAKDVILAYDDGGHFIGWWDSKGANWQGISVGGAELAEPTSTTALGLPVGP